MGNAVRCFSLFSTQAPLSTSPTFTSSLFTSQPQSLCPSSLPAISVARLLVERPAVSLTGSVGRNSAKFGSAEQLRSQTTCLVPPPPRSLTTQRQPIKSSSIFSAHKINLPLSPILIKNNCVVDQTVPFISCTQVPAWQNKTPRDSLDLIFDQPITSLPLYNLTLFFYMGSC